MENKNIIDNNIILIPFISLVRFSHLQEFVVQYVPLRGIVVHHFPLHKHFALLLFSSSRELHLFTQLVSHASSMFWIHLLYVLQGPQSLLEHSQLGYVTFSLSLHQQMHLVIDLQGSVNELSFELPIHIDLYEDQNEIMWMHYK